MTAVRTKARTAHHLASHQVARDIAANSVRVGRALAAAEHSLTDEERAEETYRVRASLMRSRTWLRDVLAQPCLPHGALTGQFCWGSDRSGVQGLCMHRVERAARADHGFQQSATRVGTGSR
jgi:hypothetical protein